MAGAFLSAAAQQSFPLTGRVLFPNDNKPVQGATVLLVDEEGNSETGILTDEKGLFRISEVQPGTYTLRVTFAGFENIEQAITMPEEAMDMGDLKLGVVVFNAEEVVIEGQEAIAEQKGDTVEYNASAFSTNPDASAQDLIQKMPGIVMENGQMKAQGEAVEQVLVDGKPFFGNDPGAALQNLPAEVVKSVQVLDQQSDQAQFTGFQDGETTKTINIVTKPERRIGRFGRAYAGYGYPDDRYKAGGSVNLFSGDTRVTLLGQTNNVNQQNFSQEDLIGVGGGGRRRWGGRGGNFLVGNQNGITTTHAAGLNFSDEWGENFEVSGSYFFNYSDNDALSEINRTYLVEGDTGQVYQEFGESSRQNINHRFNGRIEYKINEYNEIRIRPRFSLQQNASTELDSGQTVLGSSISNEFLNRRQHDRLFFLFSNQITYSHKFNDEGRSISIELETEYNTDEEESLLNSSINYFTEQVTLDSTDQTTLGSSDEWDFGLEIEFNEPVGEWGRFELEYEYQPRYSDASSRTLAYNSVIEQYSRLDTALSNEFSNQYARHEMGTGFRINLADGDFVGNVSVGYQVANLNNDQVLPQELNTRFSFGGVVARSFMRYKISKEKNLRFFYRSNIDPPSIWQLQNVLNNSNPLQLRIGNPDLQQSYDHFAFLRYSQTNTAKSSNLYVIFRGSYTQNMVGDAIYIAEGDSRIVNGITLQPGAQLTLPVNLDRSMNAFTSISYGRQIEVLKLNVNTEFSAGGSRTPSLINDQLNYSSNYNAGLGLTLSSNISENIDFTVSSRANINQVFNSLREDLNSQFYSQNSYARVNLIVGKGFVVRSQVSHQMFSGLSDGFNQSFWLWNGSVGKKLFAKQQGEISLSVFDALGQNTSIQRNVTSTYIEDVRNVVLQRYFILNFTYKFRKFSGGEGPDMEGRRGPPGRGRW